MLGVNRIEIKTFRDDKNVKGNSFDFYWIQKGKISTKYVVLLGFTITICCPATISSVGSQKFSHVWNN